ncbi:hypothetical protein [Paenibacillus sp. KR2-11]|uniref:hypothetical protein n=1 Tax=Paenibacillus sp. KR2-11 TaxID=3385500 RepID=UPI0038FCFE37
MDLAWGDGSRTEAVILSVSGQRLEIRYSQPLALAAAGQPFQGADSKPGEVYRLKPLALAAELSTISKRIFSVSLPPENREKLLRICSKGCAWTDNGFSSWMKPGSPFP